MTSELEKYISRQINNGDAIQIAAELPRFDDVRWSSLNPLHQNEKIRARISMEIAADPTLIIAPVIDPTNGIIGVFGVRRPQPDLFSEVVNVNIEPDGFDFLQERNRDEVIRDVSDSSISIIDAIKAGVVNNFEDLLRYLKNANDLEKVLKHLSRAECTKFLLQTSLGIIDVGGKELILKEIPYSKSDQAKVDFKGVHTSKRGKLYVDLLIREVGVSDQLTLLGVFENSMIRAVIDSPNNLRTLKLLQAAALFDQKVSVLLGSSYKITTRRWTLTIIDVEDEADLLLKMPELGQFFEAM